MLTPLETEGLLTVLLVLLCAHVNLARFVGLALLALCALLVFPPPSLAQRSVSASARVARPAGEPTAQPEEEAAAQPEEAAAAQSAESRGTTVTCPLGTPSCPWPRSADSYAKLRGSVLDTLSPGRRERMQ